MKASTIFINILSLASLYLAVSCNEEEQHGQTVSTILATIEQSSTRTALDGPDADGVYKTIWSSDDAIAVFSGSNAASEFKLTSGANTNTAEFEGNAASDNMVAIYPYSIVKGRTGSTISVTLPEVQEYVSGNIPQGAYPMAAVSDGAILPFYNLCSVLRLRMFGELTVKSITFTPNDATTKASGNATVNAADKMLTMSSDAEATVKLNCANGVKLTRTSTDFLMVVPAQKYTGGFTITISTDQGNVIKAVKSDVTLSRSVLYPIKPFECIMDNNRNIVFEDANFKAYLIANFDKNSDGEISHEEALEITDINVCSDNIESLAGIEYLTNLETIKCKGTFNGNPRKINGSLKSIDVTHNKKLKSLDVGYNVLGSIDISNNIELTKLSCEYNQITNLDTRFNEKLTWISCQSNDIKAINLNQNKLLETLYIWNNALSSLDVTKNENLSDLICNYNSITELDLSHNPFLYILGCNGNKLTSLDLSHNSSLVELSAYSNELETIDISQCVNLEVFNCYKNHIGHTMDISHCTKLKIFQCQINKIDKIIMPPSTDLQIFSCEENEIESLDISANTGLRGLSCYGNNLKQLDITHNVELTSVRCYDNEIESLDISNNIKISSLYCQNNPLRTLYIYEGQIDAIINKNIPSTTKIVVKGSEEPDDPEEWANKEFWHKSLGMRFTATWCGYCPNLATSFAKAISQYPNKIEMLNLHPTSSNLGFSGTSKLENIFRITGYPTGMIDYRNSIANYASNDYTARLIVNAAKETESNYPTKTGISFTSSVSGSKLNLNVKLYIKEKGDYKVTAVLVEDNIIGYQNGGGDSYNHSSIARVALSDITGDTFSTTADNKTVEKNYSVTIPSSYNKDNLKILVYVLKQYGSQPIIRTANYGDYYVDNATSAAIGTTKDLIFADGSTYGGNEDTKDGGEITLK